MDNAIWEISKATISWLIFPLIAAVTFFFRKYIRKIDLMDARISQLEVRTSVIESKIDEIRHNIEDIKRGIERLIERK